jgi:hypothetical protein
MEYLYSNSKSAEDDFEYDDEVADDAIGDDALADDAQASVDDFNGEDYGDDEIPFNDDKEYDLDDDGAINDFLFPDHDAELNDDDGKEFDDFVDDAVEDSRSYELDLPQSDKSAFVAPSANTGATTSMIDVSETEQWLGDEGNSAALPFFVVGAMVCLIAVLTAWRVKGSSRNNTKYGCKDSYSLASSTAVKRDLGV